MEFRQLATQLRAMRGGAGDACRPLCRRMLVVLAVSSSFSAAAAESFVGPNFRHGMWHFQRKMERVQSQTAGRYVLMQEETTRCVDPTISMKETFARRDVGHCHSADPQRISNRYVFPNRCDYMGPVRTEITVESDSAYIEVNALNVGTTPWVDTVVARRVGECSTP